MIRLANKHLRLDIDEAMGAAVCLMETCIDDVWTPVCVSLQDDPQTRHAANSALFPMAPFANRARKNRLSDGDMVWSVDPNTDEPLALHGTVWDRAWSIADTSETSAKFFVDVCEGFPFTFLAEMFVELDSKSVSFSLSLTNTGSSVVPVGMGFHPYFPRFPDSRICFDAERIWSEGSDHLPTRSKELMGAGGYRRSRSLPEGWQNTCFTGWAGEVEIVQPSLGYDLRILASSGLGVLMVYSQTGLKRFAIEPQSHLSGQTNVSEAGLRRLQPGEMWREAMVMHVCVRPNDAPSNSQDKGT